MNNKPIPAISSRRFRNDVARIFVKWGVPTVQVVLTEIATLHNTELLNERERIANDICTMLDKIESQDENKSTEQWKHYKHIRNSIRDTYVLK